MTHQDLGTRSSGRIGLSARGRDVLNRLRVACDAETLAGIGLTSELRDALTAAGLLERQETTLPPADYRDIFAGWSSQRGMLIDQARSQAFQQAIAAVVRPGDRVADIGAGSGILSMMAARQGAGRVHALEITGMADWADRLAAHNGLDAVTVIRGDAGAFAPDRPLDLVMGEFVGMYLIEEWRHYAAFVQVRDRALRPGGAVLPSAARMFLSALDDRGLYLNRGYGFWEAPVHGFDFSPVRAAEITAPRRHIVSADAKSLVCTRQIAEFDYLTGNERDCFFNAEAEFPYPAAGMFHGFIGHFEMDMAPGLVLGTGPSSKETHWHQSYFPVPAIHVPAGQRVAARIRSFLNEAGVMCMGLTVAGPGETVQMPDLPEHVYVLE